MSAHNDGGPAFPHSALTPRGPVMYSDAEGMTLRDYFAAKALPVVATGLHLMGQDFLDPDHYGSAAVYAYRLADAMLEARDA